MSRHHMLPPIVYVPQPKPKKIETRKSRIQMRVAGAVGAVGETDETYQPAGPTIAGLLLQNFSPIEGAENKPPSTTGLLSDGTLKAMLQAQELS
jgi:hypothetical protein